MTQATEFLAELQDIAKFTFETQIAEATGRAKVHIRHPESAVRTVTFAKPSAFWAERHGQKFRKGEGVYEPGLFASLLALRRMREPGNQTVFYDIGVLHAYVTLLGAALGGFSQIIGFEMNPRVSEFARRSIALNPKLSPRIDMVQAGMADRTELAVPCMYAGYALRIRPDDADRPRLAEEKFHAANIDLLAIDDFVTHGGAAPTIVKIDVEGSQSAILRGSEKVIAEHRPIFLIEGDGEKVVNYDGTRMKEICHWMADRGYDVVTLEHRHWAFNAIALPRNRDAWPDEDMLKQRLLVFLPAD